MDTKSILAQIEADAQEAVDDVLKEVENQVLSIHEQSDLRLSELKDTTLREARAESLLMAERMQRLAELNVRVELLEGKRELINKAFDQALEKLRALPEDQFVAWMLTQLQGVAQGTETVRAGALNDGFFTPAFLEKANAHLKAQGKPGKLTDDGGREPGMRGLLLFGQGTEVRCTFESALEQVRMNLEARLAELLFDKQ